MKIISKFKDYYDYLQGVYGIDELLVLDRTEFTPIPYEPSQNTIVDIYICDFKISGIYVKDKFLYGKEWHAHNTKDKLPRYQGKMKHFSRPHAEYKNEYEPVLTENKINTFFDCPILIGQNFAYNPRYHMYDRSYFKNPILKEYNIQSILPAEEIWKMLSTWLGKQKDSKIKQQPLTDKELIVSNGFDLKTSFRGKQ